MLKYHFLTTGDMVGRSGIDDGYCGRGAQEITPIFRFHGKAITIRNYYHVLFW